MKNLTGQTFFELTALRPLPERMDHCVVWLCQIARTALDHIIEGRPTKANWSGVRGVYWHGLKKKWIATGRIDDKPLDLGQYDSLEEAKRAREQFVSRNYKA